MEPIVPLHSELPLDINQTSTGQKLAYEQLTEICQNALGAIKVDSKPTFVSDWLILDVLVVTSSYKVSNDGLKFKPEERIRIGIPKSFPFEPPVARFTHNEYAGFPHVLWGNGICLYLSPDIDWNPFDGMFGFIEKLDLWLIAAAKNQLDPIDAPLHPPVIYELNYNFEFIIQSSTPELEGDANFWSGFAHLNPRHNNSSENGGGYNSFEVVGWSEGFNEVPKDLHVSPAILFKFQFPFEYPETIHDFLKQFELHNIEPMHLVNLLIQQTQESIEADKIFLIVGSPMRRNVCTSKPVQHIMVWRISKENFQKLVGVKSDSNDQILNRENDEFNRWSKETKIEWCNIIENRTELTIRRDKNTLANWFSGKNVLLLGCGALGSNIAEFIVRAGVRNIKIIDNKTVTPGILVRQTFYEHEIGNAKSFALSKRLKSLKMAENVEYGVKNLKYGIYPLVNDQQFDLIVNTTASRFVDLVFESEMKQHKFNCPIISCSISAKAKYGMLITRMPKFNDGFESLIREAKIKTHSSKDFQQSVDIIWPDSQEKTTFQPEPGCSEPTFVASAIDISWYASTFLNSVLTNLKKLPDESTRVQFFSQENLTSNQVDLEGSSICKIDHQLNYLTHLYPVARKKIETVIANSEKSRGKFKETGGLLFGEISESLQSVWIDFASEPPSDSKFSGLYFICGKEGTQELNNYYSENTKGSSSFIGTWHTHPVAPPIPSDTDLNAVKSIFSSNKQCRKILLLIIGMSAMTPIWEFHIFKRNELNKLIVKKRKRKRKKR